MEVDLSVARLLNAAGGFLFLILGSWVLVMSRRGPAARLLGATAATFGLTSVVDNILVVGRDHVATGLVIAFASASALFAVLLAAHLARGLPAAHRAAAVAFALAAGTLFLALMVGFGQTSIRSDAATAAIETEGLGFLLGAAFTAQGSALILLLSSAALRFYAARGRAHERARAASVAVAFGVFTVFALVGPLAILPLSSSDRGGWLVNAATLGTGMLAALAMVPFARRDRDDPLVARAAYPLLLASGFAGVALVALTDPRFGEEYGTFGIARTLGAAIFAWGILKHDVLGARLPRFAVRGGALATGALAILFTVAQVAQNFLEAHYGILMGGVVAGAFLFAAAPLQRMLERMSARGRAGTRSDEDAFRAAVRRAYRDRRFTHEEELELADLAERLGIGARRATEIRHQVESEKPTS